MMANYYPFDLKMNIGPTGDYRYGYQGEFAEEDEETGFNHFEAREYDPVIGRWMVVDPARQFYSPYLSMGNNPVGNVDPDGEFVPLLIGVGAFLLDVGIQTAANYDNSQGFNFFNSFKRIC